MENNLKNWVIDVILDKLPEYEGVECYGCDLSYKILEQYNIDGSYTYSAYEARQWVKTYFDDLGEAVEHYNCFIGEGLPNVFDNTEAFQVCILLMLADYYIQSYPKLMDFASEEIIINEKLIKNLSEWLKYQTKFYGLLDVRLYEDGESEC